MIISGKDITDECQHCGEVLDCDLFKQGHGIKQERNNISAMLRCQMEHKEKRNGYDRN